MSWYLSFAQDNIATASQYFTSPERHISPPQTIRGFPGSGLANWHGLCRKHVGSMGTGMHLCTVVSSFTCTPMAPWPWSVFQGKRHRFPTVFVFITAQNLTPLSTSLKSDSGDFWGVGLFLFGRLVGLFAPFWRWLVRILQRAPRLIKYLAWLLILCLFLMQDQGILSSSGTENPTGGLVKEGETV